MLPLLADENFNNQIVRGILRRNPDVDKDRNLMELIHTIKSLKACGLWVDRTSQKPTYLY